jgi:hypothetical protein
MAIARLVFLIAVAAGVGALPAFAQGTDASHWGVGASFAPYWKAQSRIQETFFAEGDGSLEGTEFTVGIVRGRRRGGEWGVSFVRKPIRQGATLITSDEGPNGPPGSLWRSTYQVVFTDAYLQGVEFHKFVPFTTIKDRVQIGLNVGGGIAVTKGTVDETFEFVFEDRLPNGQIRTSTNRQTDSLPADEVALRYQPLFKLEGQAAFIVAPSVKVRFGAGVNFPSVAAFRVTATFLVGG